MKRAERRPGVGPVRLSTLLLTRHLTKDNGPWRPGSEWGQMVKEHRALVRAALAAEKVLLGLDWMMGREPMVMFPERGYLVERSAQLRARLTRIGRLARGAK